MAGILLLAGALRYPGYNFSLPFLAQPDEPVHILAAQQILDLGSAKDLNHHHFPPGIISLHYLALRFLRDPAQPPGSVMGILRLAGVTTALATAALLALTGYHALGPPAGLLAAALYSVTPIYTEFARYATAETYVVFFALLALWLALVGALHHRPAWSTAAVYALMLATLFKYHAVFLAPIVLLAPLVTGRAGLRLTLANLARFALFLAWLLLLTPLLDAFKFNPARPASWMIHLQQRGGPLEFLANLLPNALANQRVALQRLGPSALIALIPGWLGLALLLKYGDRHQRLAIAGLLAAVCAWLTGISVFGNHDHHALRFLFPQLVLLTLLAGCGYALWWRALADLRTRLSRRAALAAGLAAAGIFLALTLPGLRGALWYIGWFTQPDPRNALAAWADVTLAPGNYLYKEDPDVLDPDWGGYTGVTPFNIFRPHYSPLERPIESIRAEERLYGILTHEQYERLLEADPGNFLKETVLLKRQSPQPNYPSPAMVVFRLYPMQRRADGQLGPVRLLGYELVARNLRAGDVLPFHLYWQAEAPTDGNYLVFNHLLDAEGRRVAQADGPPLPDPLQRRGTADWDDPGETLFSREFRLALPANLPPGDYTLVSGFRRSDDGARLLAPDGADSLVVTTLEVADPIAPLPPD